MRNKIYHFIICLLLLSNAGFAQWSGSTTIDNDTYRNGNVGIGTSFVPAKLTLGLTQLNDGIWLSGTSSRNIALLTNTTAGAWNALTQTGDHLLFWKGSTVDDEANTGGLAIGPWSNSTKGLKITSAGNVGIGTLETGPFKLNVAGRTGTQEIWVSGNGVQTVALVNNLTQGGWNSLTQPGDNMLLWKGPNPDQTDAGGLVIAPWSNSTNGLRITSSGNVGIGIANPGSFKLAVEGKIGAREIQVTLQNPFPDYVFDSKYKLKSLYNLENYISQNKHLPGMPSAAEVEKKGGIELGQMNTKLLEKIEELTLYIIELNKKVEKMAKENKALKGK